MFRSATVVTMILVATPALLSGCGTEQVSHQQDELGSSTAPRGTDDMMNEPIQPGKSQYVFQGNVRSIEPTDKLSAGAIRVGRDPRFLVVVEVVDAKVNDERLREGQDLTLGIHSPIKLFGKPQEDVIGRVYRFTLYSRDQSGSNQQYYYASAETISKP